MGCLSGGKQMVASSTPVDRARIEQLVREVLGERLNGASPQIIKPRSHTGGPNPLVVNVSARHVHVTEADVGVLFGPGAKLTEMRSLYQGGEFASDQTVNIVGPRNRMIPNVRILGPCRDYTQVELAYTDGIFLGLPLPLRISGNHEGTPGCVLVGTHGALNMAQGVIRAERHVHMHPDDASYFKVEDAQYMKLRIDGPCGLTFERVRVRVHPRVRLEVHIDTDEGNACDLSSATHMELIK